MLCPCCGKELTIKDNGIWSSLLCSKRILIYYYESCTLREITKDEWLVGKRAEAERVARDLERVR